GSGRATMIGPCPGAWLRAVHSDRASVPAIFARVEPVLLENPRRFTTMRPQRRKYMAEKLTPEHFLPHVNKQERIPGTHPVITMRRVDVRKLSEEEAQVAPRQPFLLIFSGPPGDVLREGLYVLEFEQGPQFQLYVIPVFTPVRDRQDYQSVFN